MNHPFGPLLLVGLIQAEPAHELRDRQHRNEFLESHRGEHRSLAERLRSVAGRRMAVAPDLTDCACPA